MRSGDRATGIRCHEKGSRTVTETAPLIVGADGKHSLVAKTLGARTYREREPRSLAFYTYWQGVPMEGGEMFARDRRIVGAWPTNDGLTVTYIGWPASEFETFQADPLRNVRDTLNATGELGARIRAGQHIGPLRGTTDLPNVIRRPYGPGWALAGDAGLVMDPITGQGMGHALRDAELLSDAVVAGLGWQHRTRQRPGRVCESPRRRDQGHVRPDRAAGVVRCAECRRPAAVLGIGRTPRVHRAVLRRAGRLGAGDQSCSRRAA